ncbi:MAG: outer membrane beta-barrel protein [Bacteroidales bacterium]
MKSIKLIIKSKRSVLILTLLLASTTLTMAQNYRFGAYISPLLSWFRTDLKEVRNEGARAGYDLGIRLEKPLSEFASLTGGLSLKTSGGRLVSNSSSTFWFPDYSVAVAAGEPVIYKISYLSVPVGIKLRTRENGYLTYFAEPGLDPAVVVSGKVDIPSIDIKGMRAMTEITRFNIGYHVNGGIEYSINGSTSLVLGAGFESTFFDVTRDRGDQEEDRTVQRFLKFIFGINF